MKQNGNNLKTSDYYIGLDVGTDSVGWAVTDLDYNVLKFKGNGMWGIRLFEEANGAEERRANRTARRRLARRKQRLLLLETLFENEMQKKDPLFFRRLKESALWADDKTENACKYSLFNDADYTDKDYLKAFPTIYHLRHELLSSAKPHDIRLVYLALHHIIKKRGHFLYETGNDEATRTADLLKDFSNYVAEEYDVSFEPVNEKAFVDTLQRSDLGITNKKKQLKEAYGSFSSLDDAPLNLQTVCDALAGAKIKLSDLFYDEELKNAEKNSFSLKDDPDELLPQLEETLGEKSELILYLKSVFDNARLAQILGNHTYISDAKIELYNKNKIELHRLKQYVRENAPAQYKLIFTVKKENVNNYVAYSRYKSESGDKSCTQEDFCAFLKKTLPDLAKDEKYADLYAEIENKSFLPRLSSTDNGLIPKQLHYIELKKILENAEQYLPFLSEKDESGLTVSEKILKIFDYRIPYYVGPLNNVTPRAWVVRSNEKITPWNMEKVVDTEKSAERFIVNLISRCTYTGEYVLPKDSLLYSEFMLLNELNPITVNGKPLPVAVKQKIVQDLFVESKRKVTKNVIKNYLCKEGFIESGDEIGGIDNDIKTTLKSLHDLKEILKKTGNNVELAENIIEHVLIFSGDKKVLQNWLKKEAPCLDETDRNYICRLKYKDWGRLSKQFLTELYTPDENGEAKSIMDMLRSTNLNLNQLLSSDYRFAESAAEYREEKFGIKDNLDQILDDLYIAPAVRRSVRQTLKIVDELVDVRKSAPKKMFIEVARGATEDLRGKRTKTRKAALLELYAACKEDSRELFPQLENEPEDRLRSDKLFLYYAQFGKCMYSGEAIELAFINDNSRYDIDHIFPQSRIKDDSLDNRVLVKAELNRIKTNQYPIPSDWRNSMHPYWSMLRKSNMISEKKYQRLIRTEPLTAEELASFVARQLTETQQATKAIATIAKKRYPETVLVYSKAKNVSDFRDSHIDEGFGKCRDMNDLHHAKDAYLNIVVGNVYYSKFTETFFRHIETENYSLNRMFDYDVPGAWDVQKSMEIVRRQMHKNNILFTRMAHEAGGALFDLQLRPFGEWQLPQKNSLAENTGSRYGGYKNLTGAFSCVVEHTEKKKRVRTIEPVYLYKKAQYEADPVAYCTQVLNLEAPEIILEKLLFDSLLEYNGSRVFVTGRTGKQLVFKHAYQFITDPETERYIKRVIKYVTRCKEQRRELPVTAYDHISREENVWLYGQFLAKLKAPVYSRLFKNIIADMEANRAVFENMSTFDQCDLLVQILKAFKCDRQCPDFSQLCKKKSVGIILFGKNISKQDSVLLINQSVTGLYEVKRDLLK